MKLAIMQPYFLPYIGYYQLISSVDTFIIYDDIKYTKKGWINRNRRLQGGESMTFSLPLKKGSDSLSVVQREISTDFDPDALLNQLRGSYSLSPYFPGVWPTIESIVRYGERNLFRYIHHSVVELCAHLGISTRIIVSSEVGIDRALKAQDKVIALCRALHADTYINPIGGLELYDRGAFRQHGVDLKFLRPRMVEYPQFGAPFVPWLSIIDVMMFNSPESVRAQVSSSYDLV